MTANRILICEDDGALRQSLVELLEAAGWQAEAVARASKVAPILRENPPDVILSDVRMPGMSGLELLATLQEDAPPLVLISAHGDISMAVQAMTDGAYSFVEKPYEPRRLLSILAHAADQHRMRQTNARLLDRLTRLSGLDRIYLGRTPETAAVRDEVLILADSPAAVLLQGETGTGKELIARALHDLGPNPGGPFLALNCATLSSERYEDEMIGETGSGRLFGANGGTLFLDEISSCPLPVQAQLLRVIEDKSVLPKGAVQPVPLSFRVISATNVDPEAAMADGTLRADLFFRISTTQLTLPTLRARRDDITLLALHFMDECARIYETTTPELTPDDLASLLAHEWPGNVRELRSVAERRVMAARRGTGSMADALRQAGGEEVPDTLRAAVASFERELIAKAISANGGRMDDVAEALGIGRRTLNEKIVKLDLDKTSLL